MSHVRRGEVWSATLEPVEGSDQGGTRPVVVVSNDHFNDLMPVHAIVPITTRRAQRRIFPSEVAVPRGAASLKVESIVLCQHVRTISRVRLGKRIGVLDPAYVKQIDAALRTHLAL